MRPAFIHRKYIAWVVTTSTDSILFRIRSEIKKKSDNSLIIHYTSVIIELHGNEYWRHLIKH